MPPPGGQRSPLDPGFIGRVAGALGASVKGAAQGGLAGAIRGATDAWFGPGQPVRPIAPPEAKGRALDYTFGTNLNYVPRSDAGAVSFATLRMMAEPGQGGLDLLRLAIETRKDQMEAQRWTIRARDRDAQDASGGPRAREIEQALRRPDRVHSFAQWQRMLLEDLLVIDAATVYLAPSAGKFRVPQVVDGALIKPLVAVDGRAPLPPDPAYQQAIKGNPAANFTSDELIYAPRNVRAHRIYGYSQTEQVINTVNLALKRYLMQSEHYDSGSVPPVVFGTPDNWTAAQVKEFQDLWDALLAGDIAALRRARFVPGAVKPYPLKAETLKDEFDEWLARIICFCFSINVQALVKQMNRATAETAKEGAAEEGLEPIKGWFADLVNQIVEKGFDAPDLEFVWMDEEIVDPATKASVCQMGRAGRPWWTADEVRRKYGDPALTPEQRAELEAEAAGGGMEAGDADLLGEPGAGNARDAPGAGGGEAEPDVAKVRAALQEAAGYGDLVEKISLRHPILRRRNGGTRARP